MPQAMITLLSALALALSACSTTGILSGAGDLPPEATGTVVIYRTTTAFQSANLAGVFVYLGDEQIGRMGTSANFKLILKPGDYTVSIKSAFAFIPGRTVGAVAFKLEPGKVHYLRYHYGFSHLVGVHPVGLHSFVAVPPEIGESFR
jgi:hypothetical protein